VCVCVFVCDHRARSGQASFAGVSAIAVWLLNLSFSSICSSLCVCEHRASSGRASFVGVSVTTVYQINKSVG